MEVRKSLCLDTIPENLYRSTPYFTHHIIRVTCTNHSTLSVPVQFSILAVAQSATWTPTTCHLRFFVTDPSVTQRHPVAVGSSRCFLGAKMSHNPWFWQKTCTCLILCLFGTGNRHTHAHVDYAAKLATGYHGFGHFVKDMRTSLLRWVSGDRPFNMDIAIGRWIRISPIFFGYYYFAIDQLAK